MPEPFSLLIAVYEGDQPDYVRRAFRSAVDDQTVRPDQVVIVRDGPVRAELADCLDELVAASPVPVTLVPLERNRASARPSTPGWRRPGSTWWPGWMPTTSRCRSGSRWSCRSSQDADIVGSGLLEFVADTDDIVGQRVPPIGAERIRRYARIHDPFNHPTVVYRRQCGPGRGRVRRPAA